MLHIYCGHLTLESKESGKGVRVSSVMFLLIVEGNDVIKESGERVRVSVSFFSSL